MILLTAPKDAEVLVARQWREFREDLPLVMLENDDGRHGYSLAAVKDSPFRTRNSTKPSQAVPEVRQAACDRVRPGICLSRRCPSGLFHGDLGSFSKRMGERARQIRAANLPGTGLSSSAVGL